MIAKTKLVIFLALLPILAYGVEIEGYVSKVDKNQNVIIFSTATENIAIKYEQFMLENKKLFKKMLSENNRKKIEKYNIPKDVIKARQRIPFGTRGDCSELPISLDDLTKLAKNTKQEEGIVGFLNRIPKGTLQSFTFAVNSMSAQKGEGEYEVSPEWPRVIRSSMDGKITISYVCNPNHQDKHNTVEIMYFDDKTQKIKSLSYNFNAKSGEGKGKKGEGKRVHHSPESCVSCHGTSPKNGEPGSEHLKYNWPEYFFWGDCDHKRGLTLYGMSDDNMGPDAHRERSNRYKGCDDDTDKKSADILKKKFIDFKKKAKLNECLKSLPWEILPKENERRVGIEKYWTNEDYKYYPYANNSQKVVNDGTGFSRKDIPNYSLRTNLRYNDTYGHLTGLRNFRLLKNNPKYEKYKYLLGMEALNCITSLERYDEIGVKIGQKLERGLGTSRMSPKDQLILRHFANDIVGFEPNDWTVHLPENLTPNLAAGRENYRANIPSDSPFSDVAIHDITQAQILLDIAKSDKSFKNSIPKTMGEGVKYFFGKRFSCIEDLGPSVSTDSSILQKAKIGKLCKKLEEKAFAIDYGSSDKKIREDDCDDGSKSVEDKIKPLKLILKENEKKLIQQGKNLAKDCVMCHSGDYELSFITDIPESGDKREIYRLRQFANDGSFWDKLSKHLSGELKPRMPFDCAGDDCFDKDETMALTAYLKSLANGDYFKNSKEEKKIPCDQTNSERDIDSKKPTSDKKSNNGSRAKEN